MKLLSHRVYRNVSGKLITKNAILKFAAVNNFVYLFICVPSTCVAYLFIANSYDGRNDSET